MERIGRTDGRSLDDDDDDDDRWDDDDDDDDRWDDDDDDDRWEGGHGHGMGIMEVVITASTVRQQAEQ